jgi:AraC-like DNA-binding protein
VSWASIAAMLGFSDQAHLVREVRALAGITPGALVRERMSDLFNTPPALRDMLEN